MQIICFEDDRVDQLRPITQARPAYAITCASFRLIDWLRRICRARSPAVSGPILELIQEIDYGLGSRMSTLKADAREFCW